MYPLVYRLIVASNLNSTNMCNYTCTQHKQLCCQSTLCQTARFSMQIMVTEKNSKSSINQECFLLLANQKISIFFSLQQGRGNLLKSSLGNLYTDIKPSKCRQALVILQPQICQLIQVTLVLYNEAFSRATSYLEEPRQTPVRTRLSCF